MSLKQNSLACNARCTSSMGVMLPPSAKQLASRRRRSWHPKTNTGCTTCKARRVKCDETRPACVRCRKANRPCEYNSPPRPWIFEPDRSAASQSEISSTASHSSSASTARSTDEASVSGTASVVRPDGESQAENGHVEGRMVLGLRQQVQILYPAIGSPIKPEEQYFFRYFLEVTAPALSRSRLSRPFWLSVLPQFAWSTDGLRYALLATAVGFDGIAQDTFDNTRKARFRKAILQFENRALSSAIKESPVVENVLAIAMTFYMFSMISGDFLKAMQHLYSVANIVRNMEDPQRHDRLVLGYSAYVARAGIEYIYATRGPCRTHLDAVFKSCEPSCIALEIRPFDQRIANALYHLRRSWHEIKLLKRLLRLRKPSHSRASDMREILERVDLEVIFFIRRWSDHEHVLLPADFEDAAKPYIPFTGSPLQPVLESFRACIESEETSASNFAYLECQSRVVLPNIAVDAGREQLVTLGDVGCILQLSPFTEEQSTIHQKFLSAFNSTVRRDWTKKEMTRLSKAAEEM